MGSFPRSKSDHSFPCAVVFLELSHGSLYVPTLYVLKHFQAVQMVVVKHLHSHDMILCGFRISIT